jgi:hypothetical protein
VQYMGRSKVKAQHPFLLLVEIVTFCPTPRSLTEVPFPSCCSASFSCEFPSFHPLPVRPLNNKAIVAILLPRLNSNAG